MEFFESKGYTGGCPVGNLAQELGDTSPVFQKKLSRAIESMVDTYTMILSEAQAAGEISKDIDPMVISLLRSTTIQFGHTKTVAYK